MIKFAFLFLTGLLMSFFSCFSQEATTNLKFDTKYYQAIDQWVVFPKKEKDSTYLYGFVYVDQTAGFTFNLESSFQIKNGEFFVMRDSLSKTSSIKSRLGSRYNSLNLALLTEEQQKKLRLPKKPEWLEIYQRGKNSVGYLKNMGYHLNHIGVSSEAIVYLKEAYGKNAKHDGVYFELVFAYNATNQYNKAKEVLLEAIKEDANKLLYYKELMYSYMSLKNYKEAEKTTVKGIELDGSDSIKAEMSLNLTSIFFNLKDYDKFKKWLLVTKSYETNNNQIKGYIEVFDKELLKLNNK